MVNALGWVAVAVLAALLLVIVTGVAIGLRHGMPVPGGPSDTQPTTMGHGFPE
jgi:hypothetical protein